ncbi:short-chain dehydrogenase/reductase family protein [Apiospora saccharicola]|uniref:Short-chain dehydrogenase/reductase family protein n=1 Tax=Apiospora saccharicola TaxID=335842 RepID=A0ABR1VNY9_9PEZI
MDRQQLGIVIHHSQYVVVGPNPKPPHLPKRHRLRLPPAVHAPPPIAAGTTLDGQTAIITGSNTGLGLEAARQLLRLNLSRLILAVRSRAKGDVAAEVLRHEFPHAQIEVWILDMEDPKSVSAFAVKCDQDLGRIDIVILNAGVQNKDAVVSAKTGNEQTFQVNYLSTVMLATLLLPILKAKAGPAGKPARLTVVTSTTAYFADFDHERPILLQFGADKYDPTKWYAREKLLQMIFVRNLSTLMDPDQVIINTVCPGLVGETEIWRTLNTKIILRYLFSAYFTLFGRSLAEGASTYVHAVVVAGRESHGGF